MSSKIADIEEVYAATFNARSKWRNILFSLEVPTATINSIGVAGENNPDICYREGLVEWLKGGQRIWKDVVDALSTPTVGHENIAKVIEKEHIQSIDDTADKTSTDNPLEAASSKELESAVEDLELDTEITKDASAMMEMQLRPPLTLKWRKGKKQTPNKMSGPIQIVLIGENVFIGGGYTGIFNDRDDSTVMKIDVQQDQCFKLPEYTAKWFGMTALEGQLVVAGGFDIKRRKPTNEIAVFDSGKWISPYPAMNSFRQTPTAVSFKNHIIVAGGRDDQDKHISSVEVLNVASRKWYSAQPIPSPRSQMKPAVISNVLYLAGGVDHSGSPVKTVHYADLGELVEKAVSSQNAPSIWQALKDTPLDLSAPLKIGKSLLAIGGRDGINSKSLIYLYSPDSKRWVLVGDLPTARYSGTSLALPNGEIIVVGGQTSTSASTYISTIDFFSITKSY